LTKGVDPLAPGDTDVTGDARNLAAGRYTTNQSRTPGGTMKMRLLLALAGLAIGFAASREVKNI